jgi:excisionase family DNA binding protein
MITRRQPPSDRDREAAAFGHERGRRHRGSGLPKYYTIKAVAEALDVSPRTVRRWIANGDLAVHHFGRSARIAESDLHAFVAMRREG